tara:strand:- start:12910 stop:13122 length:213 start_codon:yes stop_codon:yes gene_type:complete
MDADIDLGNSASPRLGDHGELEWSSKGSLKSLFASPCSASPGVVIADPGETDPERALENTRSEAIQKGDI